MKAMTDRTFYLMLALLAAAVMAGCAAGSEQELYWRSPAAAHATGAAATQPAASAYTGEGKLVWRKIDVFRVFSPFGVSPGEVIARQQAMSIQEGRSPGINIAAGKINVDDDGGGLTTTGGFKWGWLDDLWSKLKGMVWAVGLVGAIVIACWFIPATQPIVAWIGRLLGSLLPIVGSWLQRLRDSKLFTGLVTNIQSLRRTLADRGLTDTLELVDSKLSEQSPELADAIAQVKQDAAIPSVTEVISPTPTDSS